MKRKKEVVIVEAIPHSKRMRAPHRPTKAVGTKKGKRGYTRKTKNKRDPDESHAYRPSY